MKVIYCSTCLSDYKSKKAVCPQSYFPELQGSGNATVLIDPLYKENYR